MAERVAVASTVMRRWARWRKSLAVGVSTILLALLTLWVAWDSSGGRAARRRAGLNVAPRSPLYIAVEGGLGIVRGRTIDVVPFNPTTATAIAVSTELGVRTMAGMAPWTTGGSFRLDGTPIAVPAAPPATTCCFSDGTTDGRFNYSVRQDSTLLEPIGSRPLSPPALYRFDRDWSRPQVLFPLVPEGEYYGVAHSTAGDSFWLTRNTRNDGRIEQWSRQGTLLSTPIVVPWADLMGLAQDPKDNTLWVARPGSSGVLRLENFDTAGRHLGSLDVPWPHPIWRPGGAEFAWTGAH
jgi:hypothetical protein